MLVYLNVNGMISMRILVVEDEFKLAELIENRLKKENYSVDLSFDGEDGLYKALTNIYDLIILDVMLPLKDGFSILKELRDKKIYSSVIILTTWLTIDDKLEEFDKGAFYMEELVVCVNNKLRKVNDN